MKTKNKNCQLIIDRNDQANSHFKIKKDCAQMETIACYINILFANKFKLIANI